MARISSEQGQQIYQLLERVFLDRISREDFEQAIKQILELQQKDRFPRFIWKSVHYITDIDIRNKDQEYAETMREDIRSAADRYLDR